MNRLGKAVFACLLGLALFAGPAAAACIDCCPKAEASTAVAAAPACCGDCAPTLERMPDPASVATLKAAPNPDGAPRLAPRPPQTALPVASSRALLPAAVVPRAAPASATCPLRL